MKNKAFYKISFLIILIIILVIILGGYFGWQYLGEQKQEVKTLEQEQASEDEIVSRNQNAYKNENYGFEVQYSDEWNLEDDSFFNPFCDLNNLAGVNCYVYFSVSENTNLVSLDQWIKDNLYHLYFPRNEESFIVDGIEGIKADITLVHSLSGVLVTFMKDGLIYQFTTGEEVAPILYEILSTFKFLD